MMYLGMVPKLSVPGWGERNVCEQAPSVDPQKTKTWIFWEPGSWFKFGCMAQVQTQTVLSSQGGFALASSHMDSAWDVSFSQTAVSCCKIKNLKQTPPCVFEVQKKKALVIQRRIGMYLCVVSKFLMMR